MQVTEFLQPTFIILQSWPAAANTWRPSMLFIYSLFVISMVQI